jgi:hypothetical protein
MNSDCLFQMGSRFLCVSSVSNQIRRPMPKLMNAVITIPHEWTISHVRLVLMNMAGKDMRKTTNMRIELTRETVDLVSRRLTYPSQDHTCERAVVE